MLSSGLSIYHRHYTGTVTVNPELYRAERHTVVYRTNRAPFQNRLRISQSDSLTVITAESCSIDSAVSIGLRLPFQVIVELLRACPLYPYKSSTGLRP